MITETVFIPAPVTWFWDAALVDGNVPFFRDGVGGVYTVDLDAAPYVTCPDDDVRVEFAIAVLAGARRT